MPLRVEAKNAIRSAWEGYVIAFERPRIKKEGQVLTEEQQRDEAAYMVDGDPLANTSVLRLLSEMFLIRFLIIYSPIDEKQTDPSWGDKPAKLLNDKVYGKKDCSRAARMELLRCAVIEPPVQGWFRTCYLAGVIDTKKRPRFYYLTPIPTYSEDKIGKATAKQIKVLRRDKRLKGLNNEAAEGVAQALHKLGFFVANPEAVNVHVMQPPAYSDKQADTRTCGSWVFSALRCIERRNVTQAYSPVIMQKLVSGCSTASVMREYACAFDLYWSTKRTFFSYLKWATVNYDPEGKSAWTCC